jgi:predicted RNase H-like nuclease (RuvC/YqgF family)
MSWEQIAINAGGGGAVVAALLAALRSPRVRALVSRLFTEAGELKDSLESLRLVVEAQGESIEWLRTELDRTRSELDVAREQLRQTESLRLENAQLRTRVAELEAHVGRLEEELKRRRGGRPKKEIVDL